MLGKRLGINFAAASALPLHRTTYVCYAGAFNFRTCAELLKSRLRRDHRQGSLGILLTGAAQTCWGVPQDWKPCLGIHRTLPGRLSLGCCMFLPEESMEYGEAHRAPLKTTAI